MAANEILAAVSTDTGANLLTQAEYAADAQRLTGNQPGVARAKLMNKMVRQSSLTSAALAQFTADGQELDVTDGLTPVDLAAMLKKAFKGTAYGNVTTVNFAASPFALTAARAGLVLVDATDGNVVIDLPAANVLAGLPYAFRRTDTSVNTVTINRAGADTIDEGGASFALTSKATQQVRSNGATTWSTVTSVAATQAETEAGTADGKYVTPLKLRSGFAISLTASGYIKLPSWLGGWVVQWGYSVAPTAGSTNAVTTFPMAFPSACHHVLLTDFAVLTNNSVIWTYHTITTTTFTAFWTGGAVAPGSTDTRRASFLAIGK